VRTGDAATAERDAWASFCSYVQGIGSEGTENRKGATEDERVTAHVWSIELHASGAVADGDDQVSCDDLQEQWHPGRPLFTFYWRADWPTGGHGGLAEPRPILVAFHDDRNMLVFQPDPAVAGEDAPYPIPWEADPEHV